MKYMKYILTAASVAACTSMYAEQQGFSTKDINLYFRINGGRWLECHLGPVKANMQALDTILSRINKVETASRRLEVAMRKEENEDLCFIISIVFDPLSESPFSENDDARSLREDCAKGVHALQDAISDAVKALCVCEEEPANAWMYLK